MLDLIEEIADYKVKRTYLLDKPKGVRGRSSDNTKISSDFSWAPNIKLKIGLEKLIIGFLNKLNQATTQTDLQKLLIFRKFII